MTYKFPTYWEMRNGAFAHWREVLQSSAIRRQLTPVYRKKSWELKNF